MTLLVNQADLGRRWGVTRARVAQLSAKDDFPKPAHTIGIKELPLYDAEECDRWREEQLKAWKAKLKAPSSDPAPNTGEAPPSPASAPS